MRRKLLICLCAAAALACLAAGCAEKKEGAAQTPPAESAAPVGETRTYEYGGFKFQLSGVASERTESMTDDGGGKWTYTVISHYPGAVLTVLEADMSDPAYSADGKPHPNWGLYVWDGASGEERIKITDDTEPIEISADARGIFSLESSLFIFKFEEAAS